MSTHTPGPWRIIVPTETDAMTDIMANPPTYTGDEPWRVAYVLRDRNPLQHPEDEANARLIAAAPELLEACRRVAARATELVMLGALPLDDVRVVQLAIAKAEGRS
jgi:hypothetical protein